jgi:hypothetical protein
MKLFKNSNNDVFAYEIDGSQDHLIEDKISITQEEADVLIAQKQSLFPTPQPLTPTEKLASLGLTVDELKALLGAA